MTKLQHEESAGYDRHTIEYIQRAAATGLYEIRGLGAKRRVPNFDDLLFLAASLSRYPLEGYRERCVTKTVLGTRYASRPIELAIPITIAACSEVSSHSSSSHSLRWRAAARAAFGSRLSWPPRVRRPPCRIGGRRHRIEQR